MQPRVVWGCGGVIKFIESCLREGTEGTLYKNILYLYYTLFIQGKLHVYVYVHIWTEGRGGGLFAKQFLILHVCGARQD
jgi:hypothetical protein